MVHDSRFALTVPARLDALTGARHALRDWLGEHVPADVADDVALAAWEACATAVDRSAGGPGQVQVTSRALPGGVCVTVTDAGSPSAAHSTPSGGLGLTIMEAMVDRLTIRREVGCTRVVMCRAAGQ